MPGPNDPNDRPTLLSSQLGYYVRPEGASFRFDALENCFATEVAVRWAADRRGARLTAGQHAISASYSGDASFNASTSAPVNVTIAKGPTTISLTPSAPTIGQGSNATLTAIIDTSSFGDYPAGTLSFSSGATSLGTAAVFASGLNPKTGAVQGGSSLDMSVLPLGTNNITAQYSGDSNYAASTSTPVTVHVQPDFDFTVDNPIVNISAAGASGTVKLTIAGHTSYNGTVNFTSASCVGLPRESKCSFNPASVTGSGSTTLTITTTAPTSAGLFTGFDSINRLAWVATCFGTLGSVFLFGVPGRKRAVSVCGALVFLSIGDICGLWWQQWRRWWRGSRHSPGQLCCHGETANNGGLSHNVQLTINVQ